MRHPPVCGLGQLLKHAPQHDAALLQYYASLGPVVKTSPLYRQYLINDPGAIEQLLCKEVHHLSKDRVAIQRLQQMVGGGLITYSDDAWRAAKARSQPMFLPRHLEALLQQAEAIMSERVASWRTTPEATLDMVPHCLALSLEIITTLLTGRRLTEGEANALTPHVTAAVHHGCRALSLKPWVPSYHRWCFQRHAQPLHAWADALLQAMMVQPDTQPHCMTSLIDAHRAGEIDQVALASEFKTLLFAGYEATGMAMAWLCYDLAQHPTVAQQTQAEIASLCPPGTHLDATLIKQLRYTDQVIAESLRLSPPIFVMERRSRCALKVCGFDLPADALLIMSPYTLHRHPQYWPQPEVFNPARFNAPAHTRPKGCYIPYGLGPRTCIGMHLGQALLKRFMITVLRCHRLAPTQRPIKLGVGQITLKPTDGIWLRLLQIDSSKADTTLYTHSKHSLPMHEA